MKKSTGCDRRLELSELDRFSDARTELSELDRFANLSSFDRYCAKKYRRMYEKARNNAWMSFAALAVVAVLYFVLIFNL